jgi:hypothetical protein
VASAARNLGSKTTKPGWLARLSFVELAWFGLVSIAKQNVKICKAARAF